MAECYIYVKQYYKNALINYKEIDDFQPCNEMENQITYGDMQFDNNGLWCLITTIPGDIFDEDVLLHMSKGDRLLYFYMDEDEMDCEFIVIEKNEVIRRFLYYRATSDLNKDFGKLICEEKIIVKDWNDLDELIELAKISPDILFDGQ